MIARHWELAGERERGTPRISPQPKARSRCTHATMRTATHATRRTSPATTAERFAALRIVCSASERHAGAETWCADLERFDAAAAGIGDGERFAALEALGRLSTGVADRESTTAVLDAMQAIADRSSDLRRARSVRGCAAR